MKKADREARAEQSTQAARTIVKAEEQSRRSKSRRLRKLREAMEVTDTESAEMSPRAGSGGKPVS